MWSVKSVGVELQIAHVFTAQILTDKVCTMYSICIFNSVCINIMCIVLCMYSVPYMYNVQYYMYYEQYYVQCIKVLDPTPAWTSVVYIENYYTLQ